MCNQPHARVTARGGCGDVAFVAPWGMSETPPAKSAISAAAWSAIAAIAVAVIGGVVTLTTAWWQHAPGEAPFAVQVTIAEGCALNSPWPRTAMQGLALQR